MARKQVFIQHEKMKGKVDFKIADLVLNLWKLKLDVIDSSGGNKKEFVMLAFPLVGMMEEFLDIVAEYDELQSSIYSGMIIASDDESIDWQYEVMANDYGLKYIYENGRVVDEEFSGKHNFIFSGIVKFPQKHLDFVKKKVEAEADRREKEKADELLRKVVVEKIARELDEKKSNYIELKNKVAI